MGPLYACMFLSVCLFKPESFTEAWEGMCGNKVTSYFYNLFSQLNYTRHWRKVKHEVLCSVVM